MLAEMRPSELGRWLALARIEPWGAARDDLRAGYIAASLAPAWMKKAGGSGFRAADFIPEFCPPEAGEVDHVALSKKIRAALGVLPDTRRKK